jgi:predicted O-linked N-acetylglucosamine transferase (SPINDLY family)
MTEPLGLTAATDFYNDAVRRAISRQLPVVDLFSATATLSNAGQNQATVDLYRIWVAYNGDDPLLYAVYFNYGVALTAIRDHVGAINTLRECIRMKPDFAPAYINLGRAFEDSGQTGQAVGQWLALVNNLSAVTGDTVSHKLTA